MNRLSMERRAQVLGGLVEGMSIRGTVRVTGVAKNTVSKLLVDMGTAASEYQDRVLRNLSCRRLELDEIWSFCYAKQRNVPDEYDGEFGYGDVWTWVAIDPDTKLVPSWLVGERSVRDAYVFVRDLRSRLRHRVRLTSDGLAAYLTVVEPIMGSDFVDFTVLDKLYGGDETRRGKCIGLEKRTICGEVDADATTAHVERQNLTMRMGMRRFIRRTNGFSKKVENHAHAVAVHFLYQNFVRPHGTLTKKAGRPTTPAMAAGVDDHPWSLLEAVRLLDR